MEHSKEPERKCLYHSKVGLIPGTTDLLTVQPEKARLWHPSKNGLLAPSQVTPGSRKSVWWRCEKGHEWKAAVYSVVQDGCGCPYCAGTKAVPGVNDLATLRPDILKEWDYEKNTGISPAELLPSAHDKVWWKCEREHSWQAVIFSRTKADGAGCPYCTGRKVLPGFNDLATLRPKVAVQWHPGLNGSLRPEDVTCGSNKRVWWKCDEGHVWQTPVYSRTRQKASGCPVCAEVIRRRK